MYRSTPTSLAGSRSTLNSTTSGSRTALDSTTSGSRTALKSGIGHLKIALIYINDHIEDVRLDRKLKLDDFSRLTSEQMLKIVTFLLRAVIGEKPVSL